MSTRKAPCCRTCGEPMKGHKRPGGVTVCPIPKSSSTMTTTPSLPASPPATPPRRGHTPVEKVSHSPSPAFLLTPPPTFPCLRNDPSFVIPEKGPWHRRNPNWKDDTSPPEQSVLRAASLVPTVLVDDDGNTVRGSHDGDNCMDVEMDVEMDGDDDDSEDIDSHVGRQREPVVSIYSAKREDIQHLSDKAASMGVYTGVMRSPVKFKIEAESAGTYASSTEGSWLLVASRNPELVKLVVDSQNGPQVRWVTNNQIIFNGLVSAVLAVCILIVLAVCIVLSRL